MIDPLWSDEQIAAWTSSRDVRYWVGGAQTDSLLPTAAVTALLRDLRDETAQRMAELEDKVRACSEKYSAEWHNAAALEAQVVALEAQHAALVEAVRAWIRHTETWNEIDEEEFWSNSDRLWPQLRAALDAARGE